MKNLREFGYPLCNNENILTDTVYAIFFKQLLKDNLGAGADTDTAINQLLELIK